MASAKEQLSKYEKAYKKYRDLVQNRSGFSDVINRKLGEKTNYNKDLIDQQNRLLEQTFSLPAALRDEYARSPIRDPRTQEALIASRRANVGQRLGSVVDLLNARKQDQSSIIREAVAAYKDRMAGAENQAAQAFQVYQQLAAEEEAARQRKERERERKRSRRNYEEYLNNLISGAQEEVYQRAYRPSKPVTLSSLGLDSGGLTFDKPRQSLTSRAMYSAGRGLGRFGASDIGKKLTGSKFGQFSQNVFNKVFPRADVTKLPRPFYSGFSGGYLGRK